MIVFKCSSIRIFSAAGINLMIARMNTNLSTNPIVNSDCPVGNCIAVSKINFSNS